MYSFFYIFSFLDIFLGARQEVDPHIGRNGHFYQMNQMQSSVNREFKIRQRIHIQERQGLEVQVPVQVQVMLWGLQSRSHASIR